MVEKVFTTFSIGDEDYAIPVENVRIVIKEQKITDIPKTPEYVRGVINMRGKILPIMDIKKMFSIDGEMGKKIIISEVGDQEFGIAVDDVSNVVRIEEEKIEPIPEIISSSIDNKYLMGLTKIGESMVIILDVEKMFSKENFGGFTGI